MHGVKIHSPAHDGKTKSGARKPSAPSSAFGSPRRLRRTFLWLREIAGEIRRRRAEPRLTVAVDVNSFYEALTGVGWYLHQILVHLAERDDLRLRLYGQSLVEADPGAPRPVVEFPAGPAIERVVYEAPDGLVVPPWRANQILRRLAPLLAAADGNRVLFAPNYLFPPLFRFARGSAGGDDPRPRAAQGPLGGAPGFRRGAARAAGADALRGGPPAHPQRGGAAGADRDRRLPGPRAGDPPRHGHAGRTVSWRRCRRRTPARYALHVGTVEPRKNVPALLAAWRLLPARAGSIRRRWCSAAAGDGRPRRSARRSRRPSGRAGLVHLGYVGAGELAALYAGAELVALPSFYEGFGLPAIEALRAGAPLVASDLPVLREVAGDAALYAPPDRPDLWAERIAELLADPARGRS